MKLTIALLTVIPGLLVAGDLTTLEQHRALFSALPNYESITADAKDNAKRAEWLQTPSTVNIPPKSEFETTAAYSSRLNAARTEAENALQTSIAETQMKGVELNAKLRVAAGALRKTQDELDDLTTWLKVKMEAYDADTQTVSSMTPDTFQFGIGDDKRSAVVSTKRALPSFKCPVDTARQLRACSDKGELYCYIRFTRPKIKLSWETITLPTTTGEKVAEGVGWLAVAIIVNAVDRNSLQNIHPGITEAKKCGANLIQIEGWTAASYINFQDKSGNRIVEFDAARERSPQSLDAPKQEDEPAKKVTGASSYLNSPASRQESATLPEASSAAVTEQPKVAMAKGINATKDRPFVNSLGMKFVPAGSQGVLFCMWETRVKDFQAFVDATGYDAIKDGPNGMPADTIELEGNRVIMKRAGGTWKDQHFPPGNTQSGLHPVVCVSFLDAEAFCTWLTKRDAERLPTGWGYRLPTDGEWSAACGTTEFPWGDHWPPGPTDGNYSGTDAWARTAPVGSFTPNPYGLFDMGGNVWELCATWYESSMNDATILEAVPGLKNDGGQPLRVVRGGAWNRNERPILRSAFRDVSDPRGRLNCYGFRVVLAGGG